MTKAPLYVKANTALKTILGVLPIEWLGEPVYQLPLPLRSAFLACYYALRLATMKIASPTTTTPTIIHSHKPVDAGAGGVSSAGGA
jgi:hypothetical protein